MTDNHLLLYRLAELMLEQERHIMAVDDLFDDDRIGAYVKSIQIDSPYQQMLFEGVLTESVRDEKLFVSFTVEGYFHYVLGALIYNRTEGSGAEALKQILEENKLNGAKEGVEQCLINLVEKDCDEILFKLIDLGGIILKYCTKPLSILIFKAISKDNELPPSNQNDSLNLKSVLDKLIINPTENDYIVLLDSVNYLKQNQKNKCLVDLYDAIFYFENYDSLNFIKLLLIGVPLIDQNKKTEILEIIENAAECFNNNTDYPDIIFEIGTNYLIVSNYDKAIILFNKSLKIYDSFHGDFTDKYEKIYSNLGSAYWYKEDLDNMRHFYELSYNLCIKLYGMTHPSTALGLHNLALINVMKEDYDESIKIFQKSLDITIMINGSVHPETARAFSNIGSAYLRKSEFKKAFNYFSKALIIDKQVFHEQHPSLGLDYDDLGDVYFNEGEVQMAQECYEKSRFIFLNNYGMGFYHVKLIDEKLKKINGN